MVYPILPLLIRDVDEDELPALGVSCAYMAQMAPVLAGLACLYAVFVVNGAMLSHAV